MCAGYLGNRGRRLCAMGIRAAIKEPELGQDVISTIVCLGASGA